MFRFTSILIILALLLPTGCASPVESALSKALSGAAREKKISQKKVESILKEYEMLRDKDRETARRYADQIVTAIEMGADSSHIDAVRRLVVTNDGKVKV